MSLREFAVWLTVMLVLLAAMYGLYHVAYASAPAGW